MISITNAMAATTPAAMAMIGKNGKNGKNGAINPKAATAATPYLRFLTVRHGI